MQSSPWNRWPRKMAGWVRAAHLQAELEVLVAEVRSLHRRVLCRSASRLFRKGRRSRRVRIDRHKLGLLGTHQLSASNTFQDRVADSPEARIHRISEAFIRLQEVGGSQKSRLSGRPQVPLEQQCHKQSDGGHRALQELLVQKACLVGAAQSYLARGRTLKTEAAACTPKMLCVGADAASAPGLPGVHPRVLATWELTGHRWGLFGATPGSG